MQCQKCNVKFVLTYKIESETSQAGGTTRESMEQLDDLKSRLQTLKEQFVENDLNVKKAEDEADIAEELANRAEKASVVVYIIRT